MSAFQKPLPGSAPDEKWRDMRRIFALSEQP
jgi:L-rhamnose mutarotase